MTWETKRIGDFLSESNIESASPSAGRRIRVRLNAGGVEKRPLISEAEGATRYFRRRAGQFIYGKQNLHKGAFGIIPNELDGFESSSDLPAFDVADGLRPKWLEYFLKQGNFYQTLISIARGAATKRIQPSALFQVEIPIPSLKEQDELIARMDLCSIEYAKLKHEATHQISFLAKLKQAILQEAIQGKLTADWRTANTDVEPASLLLHRIQAEKAQLIATKKRGSEKSLPQITVDEIPFEIPKGWEWCRYGVLCEYVTSGSRGWQRYYAKSGALFIRAQNIKTDKLDLSDEAFVDLPNKAEGMRAKVQRNDILITITGGNLGKAALIQENIDEAYVSQHIALTRLVDTSLAKWVHQSLITEAGPRRQLLGFSRGDKPGLNLPNVRHVLIPLPPLAEQKAIVERVEALMATCRALEAEIEHSRTHADHLLQAVLREAFSGGQGEQQARPVPAASNVIPFPVKIGNISPTDLHAGILALAYQRHAPNPRHLVHFGHVKAEKIAHLVEAHLGIDLERAPVKAARGPNDYPHLKKVESRARKANWFDVQQQQADGPYVFHKRQGFEALLGRTTAALGERAAEVDALISLLLPMDTRQAEIVATLYAAWNNLLLLESSPSDEEIVHEARENWHESKLKIERERFFKALVWMREHGLIPAGRGRYVGAK